jgi:probable phosphoglycerate mutase
MIVALLRHGPTEWNAARRLQGRADIPLSPQGREQVRAWRLPPELAAARLVASPLARARETARLLGGREPALAPGLVEMDWGDWEGMTFDELRATHAQAFAAAEANGVDFRPPRGESLREVRERLTAWLAAAAAGPEPVVAVTHRGVLNALVGLLTGWNGIGRGPLKLRAGCVHVVEVAAGGRLRERAWNVPLVGTAPSA